MSKDRKHLLEWIKGIHLLVFVCLVYFAGKSEALDNTTQEFQSVSDDYLMKGRFYGKKAKPKFLTFNTNDEDISVEMTLSVPFLTIPTKKTIDATAGILSSIPSVNINVGALALTFGVTLGAIYMTPLIGKLFSLRNKTTSTHRSIDNEVSLTESLLRILEDQGVSVEECTLRAVCSLVKKSVGKQNPTSNDKIVDGIASNDWLMSKLDGTKISEAINSGRNSGECSSKYSKCKINHRSLQAISNILSYSLFNNNN